MIEGINDNKEHAKELIRVLKGINCYVNLIPYNETSNSQFKKSNKENVMKFYDTLKRNKINVTIRKEFGSNLMAACGQLRANYKEDQ
jgi:23S rRNA (adenine2503-C2)-methyltransferase